jgi:hypothetical protein
MNLSFHCVRFHQYEHVLSDCEKSFMQHYWVKKEDNSSREEDRPLMEEKIGGGANPLIQQCG